MKPFVPSRRLGLGLAIAATASMAATFGWAFPAGPYPTEAVATQHF